MHRSKLLKLAMSIKVTNPTIAGRIIRLAETITNTEEEDPDEYDFKKWWSPGKEDVGGLSGRIKEKERDKILSTIGKDEAKAIFKIKYRTGTALCAYCGDRLDPSISSIHLDRVDNAEGYNLGNVVFCCSDCNAARGPSELFDIFDFAISIRNNSKLSNITTPERGEAIIQEEADNLKKQVEQALANQDKQVKEYTSVYSRPVRKYKANVLESIQTSFNNNQEMLNADINSVDRAHKLIKKIMVDAAHILLSTVTSREYMPATLKEWKGVYDLALKENMFEVASLPGVKEEILSIFKDPSKATRIRRTETRAAEKSRRDLEVLEGKTGEITNLINDLNTMADTATRKRQSRRGLESDVKNKIIESARSLGVRPAGIIKTLHNNQEKLKPIIQELVQKYLP